MSTTVDALAPPAVAVPIEHPLTNKGIESFGTWEMWRSAWEKTNDPKQLLGLLQFGFNTLVRDKKEAIDRVCWYLDMADGHNSADNFGVRGAQTEQYEQPSLEQLSSRQRKRLLSGKAFDILCTKFFKNRNSLNERPSWFRLVSEQQVFLRMLWFFRPDEENRCIINLSEVGYGYETSHHLSVAQEFAGMFCEFVLELSHFRNSLDDFNESNRQVFEDARPAIIRLLVGLSREDILLKHDFPFNTIALNELHRIVFLQKFWYGRSQQKPQTVAEAFYLGSRAAKVHILLEIRERERVRFEEIEELRRKKEAIDRELLEYDKTRKE